MQRSEGVKLEKYKFTQHTQTSFKCFYRFVPVLDEWVLFSSFVRLVGPAIHLFALLFAKITGFFVNLKTTNFP